MVRVRFHGRGGQGAKTAARILGTAAFLDGFVAQDSPLYGAERRGAPVSAFARFSRSPILERGVIGQPDLVMVADDTLLDDPAARVLEGVTPATVVFVNTTRPVKALPAATAPVLTMDLTGLVLGRQAPLSSLSTALGAVAARLTGLSRDHLDTAVSRELSALGLAPDAIQQNMSLARECYDTAPGRPVTESAAHPAPAAPPALWTPRYQPPSSGTARIAATGTSLCRKTGDWRTFRPVLTEATCNGCTLCFVYCPEAAISLTDRDRPVIDYDFCKGCLLCVEECPTKALTAEREAAASDRAEARP